MIHDGLIMTNRQSYNVAHPALRRTQGDDSQRSEVSYFFCLPGVHGKKNGTVELSKWFDKDKQGT